MSQEKRSILQKISYEKMKRIFKENTLSHTAVMQYICSTLASRNVDCQVHKALNVCCSYKKKVQIITLFSKKILSKKEMFCGV